MHKISGIRFLILASVISQLTLSLTVLETSAQTRQPASTWQRIMNILLPPRQRQRPISRPIQQGALCFIAPSNQVVYSTRPMFLWKGNLKKVAVVNSGRDDYFWSDDKINEQKNFVIYAGEKELQPGQSYEWHGFIGKNPALLASFQVMDTQRRQVMDSELKALEVQLNAKGASKETIALERANYFIKQELWSDVLREAYSVPNPSPELSQILQKLPNELCEGAS